MSSFLIECKDLTIGYEGVPVVKDLSFSVGEGDYLCIVGENGSGKSTLMKTLLGLKHQTKGEIIFGGGLKQTQIGYLPQQTVAQKDFPATVSEVVLSGFLGKKGLIPFYTKAEKEKCRHNMELMGITELAKKSYRDLSGGQQQRVLLARALCATEKLLLLDEPVSGLDPMVTAKMYEIIDSLNKNQGITVIMISHDLQGALKYGNKILHMESGEYFFGTTGDYRRTDIFHEMSTCQCNCDCDHHTGAIKTEGGDVNA